MIQEAIYSAANLLVPPLLAPAFLLSKRGRVQLPERYGHWNLKVPESIWLHGASLGEMQGILPIASALDDYHPSLARVVSCTSPSALGLAAKISKNNKILPFDHPIWYQPVLRAINPKLFIFGETELWPSLLEALGARGCKTILVNGRVSDSAFKRYKLFAGLIGKTLSGIDYIFASSELYKERFLELGARPERITVISNTKHDQPAMNILAESEKSLAVSRLFQNPGPVVMFSSIRPGEEEIHFKAMAETMAAGLSLNYIIAPRHLEKFRFFENKLKALKLDFINYSQLAGATSCKIIFVDTVGDLQKLMPIADLAIVGGTFVDHGGHNPIEPARYGVVPVLGPYRSQILDESLALMGNQAMLEASNIDQLKTVLSQLANESKAFSQMSTKAREVALSYTGNALKIISQIKLI